MEILCAAGVILLLTGKQLILFAQLNRLLHSCVTLSATVRYGGMKYQVHSFYSYKIQTKRYKVIYLTLNQTFANQFLYGV